MNNIINSHHQRIRVTEKKYDIISWSDIPSNPPSTEDHFTMERTDEFECIIIERAVDKNKIEEQLPNEVPQVKFLQCKERVEWYCINCPGYRCQTHRDKQCSKHHKHVAIKDRMEMLSILKLTDQERRQYHINLCLKLEEQLGIKIPIYYHPKESEILDKLLLKQKLEWDQVQIELQNIQLKIKKQKEEKMKEKNKKNNNKTNNNNNNNNNNNDDEDVEDNNNNDNDCYGDDDDHHHHHHQGSFKSPDSRCDELDLEYIHNNNFYSSQLYNLMGNEEEEKKHFNPSRNIMEIRKANIRRIYMNTKDNSINNPYKLLEYDEQQKFLKLKVVQREDDVKKPYAQLEWGQRKDLLTNDKHFGGGNKDLYFVSFIGPTGSGKSSLMRAMIEDNKDKPVPGYSYDSHSTSSDLNAYSGVVKPMDVTNYKHFNILMVDSEGVGGTHPFLLNFEIPNNSTSTPSTTTNNNTTTTQSKENLEKQIRKEKIRDVYPRFLYLFSNILVVVTNHSWQERGTIVKMLNHCAQSRDEKSNTKPHLLLVFNKVAFSTCTPTQKAQLLDPEYVTKEFFKDAQTKVVESQFQSCTAMMIPQASYDHYEFPKQLEKLRQEISKLLSKGRQPFKSSEALVKMENVLNQFNQDLKEPGKELSKVDI